MAVNTCVAFATKKSLNESHLEGEEEEEENNGKEIATNMEQAGVEGNDLVQAEMNEEVRRRQSDQQKTQSILQGDSQAPSIKEFSFGLLHTNEYNILQYIVSPDF